MFIYVYIYDSGRVCVYAFLLNERVSNFINISLHIYLYMYIYVCVCMCVCVCV